MANENKSIEEVLEVAENAYEIVLVNKATGVHFPQAVVYGYNSLGQILNEYAADIGVNPKDSKVLFTNKRTGETTSDMNETAEGLHLMAGDTLMISDNAGVA